MSKTTTFLERLGLVGSVATMAAAP
jgi:hypothetical protein